MTKFLPALIAAAVLAGCLPNDEVPLSVSAPNADSVSVRMDGNTVQFMDPGEQAAVFARADAEARDACRQAGRQEAVFNTAQNVPTAEGFDIERLYLCLS